MKPFDKLMVGAGLLAAVLLVVSAMLEAPQLNNWLFRIATLVMLATSWNLMTNAGLVSLGHSAFWGVGSYSAMLAANHLDAPILVSLLVGMVSGAVLGAMLALLTGSLKGIFFAIATLALSEGLRTTALMLPDVTGGAVGLFLKQSLRPSQQMLYVLAAVGAVASVVVAILISSSRLQFASRAMRDDESAAQMLGINPRLQRLVIVAISGAMASSAGAISVWYGGYLDPDVAFTLHNTILSQIAPILGGVHTIAGPVIGSFAIIILSEATRIWFGSMEGISQLTFGMVLVICILFMPKGIEGLMRGRSARASPQTVSAQPAPAQEARP